MSLRAPLAAVVVALSTGPALAQSFNLTQSTSYSITVGNSNSCNGGAPGSFHTDNRYYRAFKLSDYPIGLPQFRVDSVMFGIEDANDGAGAGQPLTVTLYNSTSNPPTIASLTLRATANVTVSDQGQSTITVPISAVFNVASDILVVEIFTPDGQTPMNKFLIGSNAAGQTGPSFIRAASCGVTAITNLASLGFPNMHIVMRVTGNEEGPGFFTLAPCRLVDTRDLGAPIGGPILQGQQTRAFPVAGSCGIPSNAKALSINMAVTQSSAPGNIRLFPAGQAPPTVSSINYSAGQTRANNAVVSLNGSAEIAAFVGQAAGTTVHLIIDVNGYFQ